MRWLMSTVAMWDVGRGDMDVGRGDTDVDRAMVDVDGSDVGC
ncbi:hypothetical protein [Paenibacillus aceris]|uniref:Uncharacterized protein n=1 Tax=Paenibacillus aceris TaxID=869555 RepID=A0ABS4I2B0_9BACL|nr:hypothetical protein [Paenibacillus aceris]MBP1965056.1 hypothetical protein [Paenibacillus aceris]